VHPVTEDNQRSKRSIEKRKRKRHRLTTASKREIGGREIRGIECSQCSLLGIIFLIVVILAFAILFLPMQLVLFFSIASFCICCS
jgi:hypothetical protein